VTSPRHQARGQEPRGYYHYFSFGLSSYIDRLLVRIRQRVYQLFTSAFAPTPADSILDIGISENHHPSSNYLEKTYPYPGAIIGLGLEPFPDLRKDHPGLILLCGDARALPLKAGAVDFVYSHAVIEHVGSRANQAKFLTEALRVARKGVLITTPNRWHPLETHTGLPFLHYLPAPVWRRIYRLLGKGMYASEETLNLFSSRQLLRLARESGIRPGRSELHRVRWLGFPSNLVLIVRKD
jgi:hypothetical protein